MPHDFLKACGNEKTMSQRELMANNDEGMQSSVEIKLVYKNS